MPGDGHREFALCGDDVLQAEASDFANRIELLQVLRGDAGLFGHELNLMRILAGASGSRNKTGTYGTQQHRYAGT